MNGYTGPLMPGDDPRRVGPAFGRADAGSDVAPVLQPSVWTPTSLPTLREQATRLIEIGDGTAALAAATLLVDESDRLLAEAAEGFSETRQVAKQVVSAQAQLAAERARLAHDERRLNEAVSNFAERRRSLEALKDDLIAKEQDLNFKEESLASRESELRAREEAMAGLLAQHRRANRQQLSAVPAQAFMDSGPLDLRPDPLTARTERQFMECLIQFRIYAGNRSTRQISDSCGGKISPSTVSNVLRSSVLPERLEVVLAIVVGCGGGDRDQADFASAWRRLYMSQFDSTRTDIPPVRD